MPISTLNKSFILGQRYLFQATQPQKLFIVRYNGNDGTHERSGALKEKPEEMRAGWVVAMLYIVPGTFIGGVISKLFAAYLDETELFSMLDDDDDEE